MKHRKADLVEMFREVCIDRDEARSILETVCFHLRRNDHVTPPTGVTCTDQMISRIERFLSENDQSIRAAQDSEN